MKKVFISAVLIVTMLLTTIPVMAATNKVKSATSSPMFMVSSTSGKCGDIVYVNVIISNNPGITALQLNINYSSQDLKLVSVNDKKLFDDPISYSQLDKNPFIISWFSSNSKNVNNNGTMATLEFKILDNAKTGDITVSYDEENVFDSQFNNVKFSTVSGKVTVNNYVVGDVNRDGEITIADATLLQKYVAHIVSFDNQQLYLADTDSDGNVTISDATEIQKYITRLPSALGSIS